MDRDARHLARRLSLACALLCFGAGCRELPRQPGRDVVVQQAGDLNERNPADIAVLPVEVAPGLDVPEELLREKIAAGLPARQYTPIALDFVDSRVTEAAYSYGSAREDAACLVTVHGWDERFWEAGDAIDVDVELTMVDPERPSGPPLWSGRLTRTIDVTRLRNQELEARLYERAVEEVAKDLLAALPERETPVGRL